MRVGIATENFYEDVALLFEGHEVSLLDKKTFKSLPYDLIVLTGGEDINPKYYNSENGEGEFGYNNSRDAWEYELVSLIRREKVSTKKVLGICRGHQMLGVSFGSPLVQDIPASYGAGHPYSHSLTWKLDSPLKTIFPHVNSMHHQAVVPLTSSTRSIVLATEPTTRLPEIMLWSDKFLGVQFHPEWMPYERFGKPFVEFLTKWIAGESNVLSTATPPPPPAVKKATKSVLETTFWNSLYDENGEH